MTVGSDPPPETYSNINADFGPLRDWLDQHIPAFRAEPGRRWPDAIGGAPAGVLYANWRSGATTGAWPGFQIFCAWKGPCVDGKGGLGPYRIPRVLREQSHTIMHAAP